jgi:hypothetical protein
MTNLSASMGSNEHEGLKKVPVRQRTNTAMSTKEFVFVLYMYII